MLKDYVWGYGEIGKHAGLKNQCRKASRFDSGYPYQTSQIKVDKGSQTSLLIFDLSKYLGSTLILLLKYISIVVVIFVISKNYLLIFILIYYIIF